MLSTRVTSLIRLQRFHASLGREHAELWKSVYGEDADIKDEAAFRKAIADGLTSS